MNFQELNFNKEAWVWLIKNKRQQQKQAKKRYCLINNKKSFKYEIKE